MSVWDNLVGQGPIVELLQRSIERDMTHAWLFTGPPGSGRSNVARAFAAALQCESGGCGECNACRTALSGAHPDVTLVRTDRLSIEVDEVREHVRSAALRPSSGHWQVLIVEDADRLTEKAADALLKTLEEPPPRTVWMLCAPTAEDVIVTIRSRSRQIVLRTPPSREVAAMLVRRDGVEESVALEAARAAQGHVGRARALATNDAVRARRREVLAIPSSLSGLGACLSAAQNLNDAAQAHATERADDLDGRELADLRTAWGVEDRGRRPAGYQGNLSSLEKDQKRRRTRMARDAIDGGLIDLMSLYRDVLSVQLGADTEMVNADLASSVAELAARGTPEATLAHLDAILECREALTANAAPLLALERLMIRLAR
ncbi:DNA polymerase III subunit delta' [Solicola gregarius]|uniref:DNA polymerase III subunit delta' n=1 Tax=Solicola gregarius TaxID=2908642 RepID=A0AA46YIR5_9ACTN|nr:DNA polymerase III subunit delta' [Solicola gregarius]UYM03390.1 DNA polymerase III subunit delta' [Solicola gregarius]